MILPPLPETHLNNKVEKFYTAADMAFYGELCVKTVCGGKHPKKFSGAEVYRIRDMHRNGCGYKQVNKYYPMSERTFRNIVNKQGAYK
jgi:hypothetical protein